MGGGLGAAAGAVQIDDRALVDDRERVRPARRDVDARVRGRGSSEENALATDELAMARFELWESLADDEGLLTGLRRRESNPRPNRLTSVAQRSDPRDSGLQGTLIHRRFH
jgi:hypothetical protein